MSDPQMVTHPSTNQAAHGWEWNSQSIDHKSDSLTITLPSHRCCLTSWNMCFVGLYTVLWHWQMCVLCLVHVCAMHLCYLFGLTCSIFLPRTSAVEKYAGGKWCFCSWEKWISSEFSWECLWRWSDLRMSSEYWYKPLVKWSDIVANVHC